MRSSASSMEMVRGKAGGLLLMAAVAIGGVCISSVRARAQGDAAPLSAGPAGATSHPKRSAVVRPAKLRPATQESLAESVLADVLGRLWVQSDAHFDGGEFMHSINLYRIEVQGDPANFEAYGNGAWLLWSMEKNDEAIALLKQGLRANPSSFYMYDELGSHYLIHLKDPAGALPYYEQAVKYKCPFVTWHSLAHCYEKTDQWDKAVEAWVHALSYKDDPIALTNLTRARAELARRQGQLH